MNQQRSYFAAAALVLLAMITTVACSETPTQPSSLPGGLSTSLNAVDTLTSGVAVANQENDTIVTVVASSPNASEAGPVAGGFTVTRSGYYGAAAVIVNYVVSGTATPRADYAALSGSIAIPAGQTNAAVTVTPIDDTEEESSETVIITLTSGVGYAVGTPSTATVTIADNDVPVKCRCTSISYQFEPGGDKPKWQAYLVHGNSQWRVGFRIDVKCAGTGNSTQCKIVQVEKGTLKWTVGGKSGEIKGEEKKVTKFHKGKFGDPWEKEYSDALGADYPGNTTEKMSVNLNMEFELKCISSDGRTISKRFKIEGSVEANAERKGDKPALTGGDPVLTPLD